MDAPIYLAPVERDFVPHKYILYNYSQCCNACGSVHRWSKVYGETKLKAKMGHGYITNRRPVQRMKQVQYNLPIQTQEQATSVPFCHACLRPAMLSHLPKPPIPTPDPRSKLIAMHVVQKQPTHTRWQDKHGNWHVEEVEVSKGPEKAARPAPRATQRKFTVNDL